MKPIPFIIAQSLILAFAATAFSQWTAWQPWGMNRLDLNRAAAALVVSVH